MEINGRKINDFLLERPIFRGYVELSASVTFFFRRLLALKRPENTPYLFHFCNDDVGACSGFLATFSSTSPYGFTLDRWSHRKVTKTPVPILSGTFFRENSSLSTTFLLAPLKTNMTMEDPPFESMHFLLTKMGDSSLSSLVFGGVCVVIFVLHGSGKSPDPWRLGSMTTTSPPESETHRPEKHLCNGLQLLR